MDRKGTTGFQLVKASNEQPISLKGPKFSKQFVVKCAALREWLSYVLMQDG